MNPSRLFILRPVATTLLMVAILLAGAVAYHGRSQALPQVDYPTIQVLTFFPGASPDVMASSVTAPLERQFGQMPGLKQMTSNSSGGYPILTLALIAVQCGPPHRTNRCLPNPLVHSCQALASCILKLVGIPDLKPDILWLHGIDQRDKNNR